MAGFSSAHLKRGWRGLVAVLALVVLSLLVPLVFLLGFHNSVGRFADVRDSNSGSRFTNYEHSDPSGLFLEPEGNQSSNIDKIFKKLGPELQKDVIGEFVKELDDKTNDSDLPTPNTEPNGANPGGITTPAADDLEKPSSGAKEEVDGTAGIADNMQHSKTDETRKSCQLEFGSYCAWRKEHKEEMKDTMVKRLKDQLFVARAYFPSIAKLQSQDKLSREMRQNIQEYEHIFSEAATDADLPLHIEKKVQKMEEVIAKAKSFPVECSNVDKKLRQILDLTEDEAHFHMKQSAFLYQLAVQTKPKSHHCLSMRLTVEYFRSHTFDKELLLDEMRGDPSLYNYVIFSNNVLASSVVINSTIMHAKDSEKQVFHLITDRQNYFAMKLWFLRNSFKNATIHVLNMEDLNMKYFDVSEPRLLYSDEFRVSVRNIDKSPSLQRRTEYISVFGPTHYMLPEIFQNLERVVVLDDDVVVQRDLSPLWSLDMEGKVNGAVEYCGLKLGHLKGYLHGYNYDGNSCAWISGLNVIDLNKWRELNLSQTYWRLIQTTKNGAVSKVGGLPANLLTFHNQIYGLDNSWSLSGLGHKYGVDEQSIKEAAILHYNGNMKPWLDLGIPKYKGYWKRFLKIDDQYMDECNVNP